MYKKPPIGNEYSNRKAKLLSVAVVLLAAGKSTRMKSSRPKVLHELGGVPLFVHALQSVSNVDVSRIIAVVGPDIDRFRRSFEEFDQRIEVAIQLEQLGTGHALASGLEYLGSYNGPVLALYGDTPFVSSETISRLLASVRQGAAIAVAGFKPVDPGSYGRLILDDSGCLKKIVEFRDASPDEKNVDICNSGIVCAQMSALDEYLPSLSDENASGEFYLTDIVGIATADGRKCSAVICSEEETVGVNNRHELVRAEAIFQEQRRRAAIESGVTLVAPDTVYFSYDTRIDRDAVVEPNVIFGKGVLIESNVRIRAFSYLEGCVVRSGASVGPFARLRTGTIIGNDVRIGNFVEIKASTIGQETKIQHLSYVGDAVVGDNTNIGAGTVVCNYDGSRKHKTIIGNESFIGSNTLLIAPVEVGDRALTAAGSVITTNVPDEALAVARGRQVNKPGLAKKILNRRGNGGRENSEQ